MKETEQPMMKYGLLACGKIPAYGPITPSMTELALVVCDRVYWQLWRDHLAKDIVFDLEYAQNHDNGNAQYCDSGNTISV